MGEVGKVSGRPLPLPPSSDGEFTRGLGAPLPSDRDWIWVELALIALVITVFTMIGSVFCA